MIRSMLMIVVLLGIAAPASAGRYSYGSYGGARSYPVTRVGRTSGYSTGYGRFTPLPSASSRRLAPGARVYDAGTIRLSAPRTGGSRR